MNTNGSFLETLGNFGSFLLELLISAIWGLYMLISFVFTKIAEFFGGFGMPFLPSTSKILKENLISGTLLIIFILYILLMNISAFNLFRKDKLKAKKQSGKDVNGKIMRISERRLLTRCFFGGAIGGYLGMKICRHKTLKRKFTVGVGTMAVVQLLIYNFVLGFFGFWLYMS